MSKSDSSAPKKGSDSQVPAVKQESKNSKKQWLEIYKGTRTESSPKGKNALPLQKLEAQWKSMKSGNYAFHQLRKFAEAMLKAGDNVGEIYDISPEVVVDMLTNDVDEVERFEGLLEDILKAIRRFVEAKTPADMKVAAEKGDAESQWFADLKAAKIAGDKARIKQLQAEYFDL